MSKYNNKIDLIRLAARQRELLWLIFLSIVSFILIIIGSFYGIILAAAIGGIGFLLFQLLSFIQLFRVCNALRISQIVPLLMLLVFFIPLAGIIVLLVINSKVNSRLKTTGVRIGLLGVSRSEYPKLMSGHCVQCGYDRVGLEVKQLCPECGLAPHSHERVARSRGLW